MDLTRTPNVSPPAPLDGVYRYELIQTTGMSGDGTYYIDLWFIYAQDSSNLPQDDLLELKAGERVARDNNGLITIIKNKPSLKLVVDNG